MDKLVTPNFVIDKSGWSKVKFGDVAFEPKETVKDPAAEGIEHVVGLEHIDTEDIHLRRSAGIEESTTFTKKFSKGDVLFGRRRAYLKKAARAEFDGICSGDITVFRAKKNLLPELLPFIVNNDKFFDYAIKHSAGGLSPRVKFKDLADYEFFLPQKKEQADLAELLWNAVVYVDYLKVSYEKLIRLKCSILEELFTINKFNSDSKIADIEKASFKKIEFGKICDESMFGPRFSSDLYDQNGNIASLRTTDLSDEGEINLSTMPKAIIHTDKFKDHFMQPGDLVISRSGTCGVTAVFEGFDIPVIPAAFLIRFRLKKNINPHYVKLFFNSSIGREMTSRIASGAVQKNLTSKGILALEIPLPDSKVQEQVVKLIECLNIELLRSHIVSSNKLRMNLINQVF